MGRFTVYLFFGFQVFHCKNSVVKEKWLWFLQRSILKGMFERLS